MERRRLLRLLSVYSGSAVSAPLLEALRKTRLQTDVLLETQSVSAATVDNWESIANNYGYIALTSPPFTLLAQTMCHLNELQRTLSQRQPLDFQKRLYRVMAQLAGLIAIASNSVGQEGQEWFHTARLAADETGDRALRAWVLAYEAMSNLWYGRPVIRAVELSRMAQAIAGTTPSAAGALAAAMEARAQARLGRRQEAQAAVRRSDGIFDRLGSEDTTPNIFGLSEHLLRMCQENALMFIGDTPAALSVQQRSFEIPGDVIDVALVKIDRSICYIRSGEPEHGCRLAGQALDELRPESRRGIPLMRARQAISMIHNSDRFLSPVKDLHEMLRDLQAAQSQATADGPPSNAP
ncbi:hypothetical protein [Frankia sp. CiP3]|uniref:hypothetical protein n=1 Tax=Frankia sp. CiP3 TaxID=2880971 RepID=UPI001EF46CFD|nr:hypothetical protein [Frankia sp. CiP3]